MSNSYLKKYILLNIFPLSICKSLVTQNIPFSPMTFLYGTWYTSNHWSPVTFTKLNGSLFSTFKPDTENFSLSWFQTQKPASVTGYITYYRVYTVGSASFHLSLLAGVAWGYYNRPVLDVSLISPIKETRQTLRVTSMSPWLLPKPQCLHRTSLYTKPYNVWHMY